MSHISSHKKIIIPLVILVAAVLIFYFYGTSKNHFTGVVEATILSHTSEVSGKVLEMPIELGTHVSKGDMIARIDSTAQEYAYEQLQLTLKKNQIALADLDVSGGKNQAENTISIAQSSYNSAVSANQKAALDYQNAQSLYSQGAITKDALDKAKVAADAAASGVTSAKAQLDNARSSSSSESMSLEIAKIESQLDEMKKDLEKYTIKAAADGVIMSKSYVLGDMIAPGYNLSDIAADGKNYFVFYLPIKKLYSMEYGQTYNVTSGGNTYSAVIKYIDVESEYTPKDMQTAANKNKESIKIKLLLQKDCPLKPGQEADIDLDLT